MLDTLRKIGEQLLEDKNVWARYTIEPDYDTEKKNWVCPILFDCTEGKVKVLNKELERFKPDESAINYRYVKATRKGPRQTKFDLTAERDDIKNIRESVLGKKNKQPSLLSLIEKDFEHLEGSLFYEILIEIYESVDNAEILTKKKIKDLVGDNYKNIALFVSYVKTKSLDEIKPLSHFDEFEEITKGVFFRENPQEGISHLSGDKGDEIVRAQFWSRYNIHKVFQTESVNYASEFEKSNFFKYYQGTNDDFDFLDRASRYVLNNFQTQIAGIPHIIVPNFFSKSLSTFDLEETEIYLNRSSEFLFNLMPYNESIERELSKNDVFWVNYIAFDAGGGKSFKIINHIKDVNNDYLKKTIQAFFKAGIDFGDYIGEKYNFNLKSVYYVIPVRESGKRTILNPALNLFKDVLEQKPIQVETLYKLFIKLIACYKSGHFDKSKNPKHQAFPNISIPKKIKDSQIQIFDYGVKNVFKYLALIKALKNLNLIIMEENTSNGNLNRMQDLYPNKQVDEFLSLKECTRNQVALFCLGRALNVVGYAQERKNHPSKPILNKVNFKGMDLSDSKDLYGALMEKGVQYQTVTTGKGNIFQVRSNIEQWLDLYGKYLDEEGWDLSKEEAVFYLLAGYVFKPSSKYSSKTEDDSTE